jgi:hypothetical protein
MNRGFLIEIQKGLTEEEDKEAREFIDSFVMTTLHNDFEFPNKGSGGRRSYIRRNTFGQLLDSKQRTLVFRRISKRLRRFAVVKPDTLVDHETGSPVEYTKCCCPTCLGGKKVKWKNKPETYEYVRIGEIRG